MIEHPVEALKNGANVYAWNASNNNNSNNKQDNDTISPYTEHKMGCCTSIRIILSETSFPKDKKCIKLYKHRNPMNMTGKITQCNIQKTV